MLNKQLWTGPSFSRRLELAAGQPSGFDYMRLALAILVVCYHSVVTAYGDDAQREFYATSFGQLARLILPMFFSLSGFLVAGSLERSPGITTFLGLRALRIFPALAVDTVFCALVLGTLFTSLPLREYFQHPDFPNYFQNILGIIHFQLPGVFEGNPSNTVNGQLWTIPFELECYIVLAALGIFGVHRRRGAFVLLLCAAVLALEFRVVFQGAQPWAGRLLVLCFLAGVALYLYREVVQSKPVYFALAAALSLISLITPKLYYLSAFPVAYATAYIGAFNPKKIALIKSGDYSYGIFLYGFPIQQVLVALTPLARDWRVNLLLALPATFFFAALSWHLIEKRVLAKKGVMKIIQAKVPPNQLPKFFDFFRQLKP